MIKSPINHKELIEKFIEELPDEKKNVFVLAYLYDCRVSLSGAEFRLKNTVKSLIRQFITEHPGYNGKSVYDDHELISHYGVDETFSNVIYKEIVGKEASKLLGGTIPCLVYEITYEIITIAESEY